MKLKQFTGSRKFSWIIVGAGWGLSVIVFWFLPMFIPTHFNANGMIDDYSDKIQIFLFPLIQMAIMFLTGREKIKYILMHSKTFLHEVQYNWIVSGICFFILLGEIRIICAALL